MKLYNTIAKTKTNHTKNKKLENERGVQRRVMIYICLSSPSKLMTDQDSSPGLWVSAHCLQWALWSFQTSFGAVRGEVQEGGVRTGSR